MGDLEKQRQIGRDCANRLSAVLAGNIPGVKEEIRFSYFENSFRLWQGDRGNPERTAYISVEQILTLNDEELSNLIYSSLSEE
ncbi:MAG: hypothetical protein O2807_05220 [bacterium]|nr:hypothetical protein [bacterium]